MTYAKSPVLARTRFAVAAVATSTVLLGGCSVLSETREIVEREIDTTEVLREQMRARSASSAILVQDRAKIAGEEIPVKVQEVLPPIFEQRVTHVTAGQTLDETLTAISRQIGIPVWLTEFASDGFGGDYNTRSSGQGNTPIQLQYTGSLKGLFDQLAQTARLYWRFNEGRVEFFLYETRHYYVHLPMGAHSISSSISSSGRVRSSGGGAGSDSDSLGSIDVRADGMLVDPYGTLTRTITAMLMEDDGSTDIVEDSNNRRNRVGLDEVDNTGSSTRRNNEDNRNRRGASRVVVSPEMGMITVTAPPTSLDRIANYIEQVNRRFSKNVMIDVKIYDVALNDQAGVGFSADLFYKRLGSYGIQLASGVMGVTGTTASDLDLLNAINVAKNPVTTTVTGIHPITGLPFTQTTVTSAPPAPLVPPRFSGSEAMVRALSTFGRIASITSGQVIAVNGQPAPLQIGSEITYLAGTETIERGINTVGGTRLDTRLITERLSVGLTANFLPQVLGDNRILLQYQLNSRVLTGMATMIGGDGNPIQLPSINSQTLQQQAFVRDGEAIVLFGVEQNANSITGNQSIPLNYGRDANQDRTLRVILMQIFGGGENANR